MSNISSSTNSNSDTLLPLEKSLPYTFHNKTLLNIACRHSSLKSSQDFGPNNERLEFLGDSVLGLIIAEILYNKHPESSEGDLSNYKRNLVDSEILNKLGQKLQLEQFIIMSEGAEKEGGRENPEMIADTLEAIIGAIFLDSNYEVTKNIINHLWSEELSASTNSQKPDKNIIQEYCQKHVLSSPEYKIPDDRDDNLMFTCTLTIPNASQFSLPSTGTGKTKRLAEKNAANNFLETYPFIQSVIGDDSLPQNNQVISTKNPVSIVLEYTQKEKLLKPVYVEISRVGPPHQPLFTISLKVGSFPPITAVGGTIMEAKQNAAKQFLRENKDKINEKTK